MLQSIKSALDTALYLEIFQGQNTTVDNNIPELEVLGSNKPKVLLCDNGRFDTDEGVKGMLFGLALLTIWLLTCT